MPCDPCNPNCVHFITNQVDAPESVSDYREIAWWLSHQNVQIFVDVSGEEEEWYLQFKTPALVQATENPFAHEPQQSQAPDGLLTTSQEEPEDKTYVFATLAQFQEWAKENPPISDEEAEEEDDDEEDDDEEYEDEDDDTESEDDDSEGGEEYDEDEPSQPPPIQPAQPPVQPQQPFQPPPNPQPPSSTFP